MKYLRYLVAAICTLTLLSLGMYYINSKPNPEKDIKNVNNIKKTDYMFYVVIENNSINIYKGNPASKSYVKTISGANIYDLPEKTYQELKMGIYFNTKEELEAFIETVTS